MFNVADFLKIADNVYGSIAEQEVCGDVKRWIDTGSYTFNAIVSGSIFKGLPDNKVVCLAGVESTGKTFFALSACKYFLDSDPNAVVLYFETESALTQDILISRHIDLKRFGILPIATVQEFKTQALKIVNKYLDDPKTPLMFVLDSLGNLSTTKEMEDSAAGADTRDMTRAQIIKATFRVLSLKLGAAGIPMVITNHVYDNIGAGPYAAKEQSGGSGPKYAASIIIGLTKAKEKDGDTHIGSVISCTAIKSRLTKEGSKVKALIRFNGGLDRYYGLIDLAEKAGVFKKVSTKYELPDGRKFFGKAIERDPEKFFTADVLQSIDEYVKKEFQYGVGEEDDIRIEGETGYDEE
jgi:RecA/RadA recombinase